MVKNLSTDPRTSHWRDAQAVGWAAASKFALSHRLSRSKTPLTCRINNPFAFLSVDHKKGLFIARQTGMKKTELGSRNEQQDNLTGMRIVKYIHENFLTRVVGLDLSYL
ncbi:hypothetical protein WA026_009389 [Henosepilachna vigintioctopunctata]|uniref:Uncharacterized protein n=1 Tax=Henosepilachna vigintioctopunctata TaxID=420089 RepID=A0AAW1U4T7_9CUCU